MIVTYLQVTGRPSYQMTRLWLRFIR